MRPSSSLIQFLLLASILLAAVTILYLGVLSLALDKLGLSRHSATLLLVGTLLGSVINLPLFQIRAEAPPGGAPPHPPNFPFGRPVPFTGRTIIAINVGGALIPVSFSIFLAATNQLPPLPLLLSISIVTAVCYFASRPIRGLGMGMPIFVAPVAAAMTAVMLEPQHSAPLAYICGTLGVLVGADLLHLKDIRKIGIPLASIGGAGTFDGIFLTGIVAVLLS